MLRKEKPWQVLRIAFGKVYVHYEYIVLTISIFLLSLILLLFLQNWGYYRLLFSGLFKLREAIALTLKSVMVFPGNFEEINFIVLLTVLILLSVNVSFVLFTVRRRIKNSSKLGIVSLLIGYLGLGCASCGSVMLSFLLGVSATSSFLGILPYNGKEVGYISVALLLISIYLAARKIVNPLNCKIKNI